MINRNFTAVFQSTMNQGFNIKMGQVGVDTNSLKPKIVTVELLATSWVHRNNNLYSQVVSIEGVTENSQVDLTPSVEQLVAFYEKDLTFVTENEDGIVTVYAIGQIPTNDYIMQATITEVVA